PYLTVGVPDHGAQLAQRGLRVRATGLHLLDVSHGLRVLFLREWIDRTELLATARQALDPREKRPPLLLVQAAARPRRLAAGARLIALPGVGGRPCLRLGEPQALGDLFQLQLRLADLVAQALRDHLRLGHAIGEDAKPRLDLRLLAGAGAQLA